ncbi:MAG TPA: tRNA lysidine(34) synthetase TilS [Gemmatimonadaceae bacterium]|nr:tRNA lysidine(34) synthetase TilS [Gemmatimonadaceae bacterium]
MVEEQVARAFAAVPRVVLAVSGGCDSMVLMHAAARAAPGRIAAVATFDHGSGAAARRAAALVVREAERLGLPVRHGRARAVLRGEAQWRAARWAFLRAVARDAEAVVATAHTRDDQLETVIMRVLRGSGARGLAGLYAESDVRRPFVELPRTEVIAYARAHGVRWVEDPSNRSRAHLRNRIRLDLAPALERVRPGFALELLALARRAAALRADVEREANALGARREGAALAVARDALLRYDANGLAMLWPVLAAGLGLALDRRGVARLAAFTRDGRPGARIPLAGGFEAVAHRGNILLRPAIHQVAAARPVRVGRGVATVGAWRFRPAPAAGDALWCAALPADAELTARAWRPGDRMTPLGADAPRRVKGLLRDAGLDAARRAGWPVVLAGEEIVWIPGVRRSLAATERSGRPVVTLCCEPRDDG